MFLPNDKQPLLALAKQSGVSVNEIMAFINNGGTAFLTAAWTAYAAEMLKDTSFLENYTPVGAYDLGRRTFEDISIDFKKQFEEIEEND